MFRRVSFFLAFVWIIVAARAQAVEAPPQHFNQEGEGERQTERSPCSRRRAGGDLHTSEMNLTCAKITTRQSGTDFQIPNLPWLDGELDLAADARDLARLLAQQIRFGCARNG